MTTLKGKVSAATVDGIVRELMAPYRKQCETADEAFERYVGSVARMYVPDEVLELCANNELEKYFKKARIRVTVSTVDGPILRNVYDADVPWADDTTLDLTDGSPTGKKASALYADKVGARETMDAMERKIRCALAHCGTFQRLKAEFPEAYEAAERISGKPLTGCDAIESVRAELSKNAKS